MSIQLVLTPVIPIELSETWAYSGDTTFVQFFFVFTYQIDQFIFKTGSVNIWF